MTLICPARAEKTDKVWYRVLAVTFFLYLNLPPHLGQVTDPAILYQRGHHFQVTWPWNQKPNSTGNPFAALAQPSPSSKTQERFFRVALQQTAKSPTSYRNDSNFDAWHTVAILRPVPAILQPLTWLWRHFRVVFYSRFVQLEHGVQLNHGRHFVSHSRHFAAQLLAMTSLPCRRLHDLSSFTTAAIFVPFPPFCSPAREYDVTSASSSIQDLSSLSMESSSSVRSVSIVPISSSTSAADLDHRKKNKTFDHFRT